MQRVLTCLKYPSQSWPGWKIFIFVRGTGTACQPACMRYRLKNTGVAVLSWRRFHDWPCCHALHFLPQAGPAGSLRGGFAGLPAGIGLSFSLQLLIYPGCAAHQSSNSHSRFGHAFVLEREQIDWLFDHYLRTPADREDWRFAPLNTPDVDGLAPATSLARSDPLFDEGLLYADKLRAAGVAVYLEIYK